MTFCGILKLSHDVWRFVLDAIILSGVISFCRGATLTYLYVSYFSLKFGILAHHGNWVCCTHSSTQTAHFKRILQLDGRATISPILHCLHDFARQDVRATLSKVELLHTKAASQFWTPLDRLELACPFPSSGTCLHKHPLQMHSTKKKRWTLRGGPWCTLPQNMLSPPECFLEVHTTVLGLVEDQVASYRETWSKDAWGG